MRAILAVLIIILPIKIMAEDLLLKCNHNDGGTRHFLVSPNKSTVQLIDNEAGDICELKVLPNMYIWDCSKTDKIYAQHGIVNRYSGEWESEIGEPPWGEMSQNNILLFGSCEKMEGGKKY